MERSSSYIAIPPGVTIKEQLEGREMSQKEFALRMDISEKHLSRLINGKVQLTPEMAVKLETVLGIPASFWSKLEAIYREDLVKVEMENSMEADEVLVKRFPYDEMAGQGWFPEANDFKDRVLNLRKFFGVVKLSLLENSLITRIACRRLAVTEESDLTLLACAQQAKILAKKIETKAFNAKAMPEYILKIKQLSREKADDYVSESVGILSENGIALILLPHISESLLQGVTFLDGNKVVIGLTEEEDINKFRFNLFHELGHIALGHLERSTELIAEDEKDADDWANQMIES